MEEEGGFFSSIGDWFSEPATLGDGSGDDRETLGSIAGDDRWEASAEDQARAADYNTESDRIASGAEDPFTESNALQGNEVDWGGYNPEPASGTVDGIGSIGWLKSFGGDSFNDPLGDPLKRLPVGTLGNLAKLAGQVGGAASRDTSSLPSGRPQQSLYPRPVNYSGPYQPMVIEPMTTTGRGGAAVVRPAASITAAAGGSDILLIGGVAVVAFLLLSK
jgi:hypothetical protein